MVLFPVCQELRVLGDEIGVSLTRINPRGVNGPRGLICFYLTDALVGRL